MVLAEAMAARLPVVASSSGAIPEVLQGYGQLFAPGDWVGLADALAAGPLASSPGTRREDDSDLVQRYSNAAAAERLGDAYAELVGR